MSYMLFITPEAREPGPGGIGSLSTGTSRSLEAGLVKVLSVLMKTHRLPVCHNFRMK